MRTGSNVENPEARDVREALVIIGKLLSLTGLLVAARGDSQDIEEFRTLTERYEALKANYDDLERRKAAAHAQG